MEYRDSSDDSESSSVPSTGVHHHGSDNDEVESRHSGQNLDVSQAAYFVEAERTYNNSSWVYRFPVDQEEVLRQDRQHYVMLGSLPGLYRGPVDDILNDRSRRRRLLDIGCGTGIWLQEMAEIFPHVDCIGIGSTQLRNCTFMQVNAPTGLRVFGEESFDVINMRQMLQSTNEYPSLVNAAFRLLRPGGVLLLHEPQLKLHSAWQGYTVDDLAPYVTRLMAYLEAAHQYRGVDTELWTRMEQLLVETGFDEDAIEVFYHYRQVCPSDPHTEHGANECLNGVNYLYATRLMILECGVTDEDGFDEAFAGSSEEVRGNSSGRAGPLGAQGGVEPMGLLVGGKTVKKMVWQYFL